MEISEFKKLMGKKILVDYRFGNELQQWSMEAFYIDENGKIRNRIVPSLIGEVFAKGAYNPREMGVKK